MIRRILLKCWWITSSPRTDSKMWIEFEWMNAGISSLNYFWLFVPFGHSLCVVIPFWSWSYTLDLLPSISYALWVSNAFTMRIIDYIYALSPLYTFPLILISIEYMYLEWNSNTISISEWNTLANVSWNGFHGASTRSLAHSLPLHSLCFCLCLWSTVRMISLCTLSVWRRLMISCLFCCPSCDRWIGFESMWRWLQSVPNNVVFSCRIKCCCWWPTTILHLDMNDTVSRAMSISMSCDSEVCVPRDLRSRSPDEMRSDKVCNALFIFSF